MKLFQLSSMAVGSFIGLWLLGEQQGRYKGEGDHDGSLASCSSGLLGASEPLRGWARGWISHPEPLKAQPTGRHGPDLDYSRGGKLGMGSARREVAFCERH